MTVRCSLLVGGSRLLIVDVLDVGRWSLDIGLWLLVVCVGYLLLGVVCWPVDVD